MKKFLLPFCLLCFGQLAAQVCFVIDSTYVPSYPGASCSHDFNNDGIVDLAAAYSAGVNIYLGTGAGNFSAATHFPSGGAIGQTLVKGDFNLDGNMDLAMKSSGNNVAVLLGNGIGSFAAPLLTSIAGPSSNELTAGDFNEDGKLDIATNYDGGNNIKVAMGTGSGTFGTATTYTVGVNPYGLCCADFSGDGHLDLAVVNWNSSSVSVLTGTGTGVFNTPVNYPVGANPANLLYNDFNGDGYLDLATVNNSNTISVLLGTAAGTFGATANYTIGNSPNKIACADFNGDSKLDLVVANVNTSYLSVILGSGTGSFSSITNITLPATSSALVATDLNADNKADIAACNNGGLSILLNGLPFMNIIGAAAVCPATNVTLKAMGATTYTWSPNAGSSNADSVVVAPSITTTYSVTGKTGTCSVTKAVTVTVTPALTVTGTTTLCSGNNTTLTANGATSYTWMPGNINTATISISPATTTVYTLTGAQGACVNTKTVNVTVSTTPTISISGATSICSGNSVTLTASGATSYTWLPGGLTGASRTFAPASTTVYTITGKTGACSATTTYTVNVTSPPTLSITGNLSICQGDSTLLMANGATSYTWMPGNVTTSTTSISPPTNTTYTLTGSLGPCLSSKTSTVIVNATPSVSISGSNPTCSGNGLTLTGSGATNYTWFPGGSMGSIITFTPSSTVTYTLVGETSACVDSASFIANVSPTPTLVVNGNLAICQGDSTMLTANGAVTYTWMPGSLVSNTTVVSPATPSTYTLLGDDGICSSSQTFFIMINQLPNVVANASTSSLCTGDSVTLTGTGASTFFWSSGVQNGIAFAPTSSQTYIVIGTDSSGCSASDTVLILIQQCVWPGDADENLIADNLDLLPIGVKYGSFGPFRASQGNSWLAHLAADWSDTLISGLNIKYVDCNGDGTINMNDTLAVHLNYGSTHVAKNAPYSVATGNPEIFIQFDKPSYYPSDTVRAFVNIGSAQAYQNNFYGAGFSISYDNSIVQTGTEEFYFHDSWIGVINQDQLKFSKLFTGIGKVDASLVRITHTDTSGYGQIATLKFVLSNTITNSHLLVSSFSGVKIDHHGNITPMITGTDSITIVQPTTGTVTHASKYFLVRPNPTTEYIRIDSDEYLGMVSIFTSVGAVIREERCESKTLQMDISNLPAGLYYLTSKKHSFKIIKLDFH